MGRRLKVRVLMTDAPGQLLELFKLVDAFGGIVDQVKHARNNSQIDWDRVMVTIEAKMSCLEATKALKEALKAKYKVVEFPTENLIPK